MEVTNSHELAVSPSTKWGRAGQRTRVLLSKPRRMNETQQHQAAGTQRGALRTSASVTWSQGFPEKVTWDQGSAGGPGAGGGEEKLHRPEAEEARQVSQSQDGEHRECGEEPVLKQRTDHQVPGIQQKGRQYSSKVGAMAELEDTFRNPL